MAEPSIEPPKPGVGDDLGFRLLEQLPVAVLVVDGKGTPVFMNRTGRELLGKDADPEADMTTLPEVYRAYQAGTDHLYPHDQGSLGRALRDGAPAEVDDAEIRRPEGVIRLHSRATPVFDAGGSLEGAVVVFRDVTEAKRAEAELRLTHELALALSGAATLEDALALAVRRVGEAIGWSFGQAWLPDPSGSYLECARIMHCGSKRFAEFRTASEATTYALGAGLPGSVWATRRAGWIDEVSREPGLRSAAAGKVGLRAGLAVPVMAGDEAVAILEFFVTEPRPEDPGLMRLVGTVAAQLGAIVRRRQAEDALRRSERELRAMDRLKNTFLQGVSHELRTPLGAMRGISLLLARDLEREEPRLSKEQRLELLNRMAGTTRSMNRLLDDLLDLDRLILGILEPRRSRADVAEVVRVALSECEATGDRDIRLELESAVMQLDESKVERIVENLVSNAAKYSPAPSPIWVKVTAEPGGALIAVEDAGAGVPEAMRDRIFEPFNRGGESTKPGLGIGLSLVAAFAQLHGGRAWVEDREGGGASFRVRLSETEEGLEEPVARIGGAPA